MGFQTSVKITPAIAIAGDFAGANPRASYPAPEGGFIAGSGGVTVGRFAWLQADGITLLNSAASGKPTGFVPRLQQSLITAFLAETGNVVPAGNPVDLMKTGDYFMTANSAAAARNQKVFASLTDGSTRIANAGATVAGYVETDFVVSRDCLSGELTIGSL